MNLRSIAVTGLGLVTALTIAVVPAQAEPGGTFAPDQPATPGFSVNAAGVDNPTAEEALAAVEDLFAAKPEGRRSRAIEDGARPEATLAMRDLAVRMDNLSDADRASAERLLARPVEGRLTNADVRSINGQLKSSCPASKSYCVHWTASATADQASSANVKATKKVLNKVIGKYARAGLRKPLADGNVAGGPGNPNGRIDVFLMDLRQHGLYGYCANDAALPPGTYVAPVYCVLDNDFKGYNRSAAESRKVTVAHEYFHAVQAAYDWREDAWFMEGMAAWAEDEVYDSINDNRQYLPGSQLAFPFAPLDYYWQGQSSTPVPSVYGSWIFFRYLSERWKKNKKAPLKMARAILSRADATAAGPDDYSVKAINHVIKKNKKVYKGGFARVYNEFAAANRKPKKYYAEGKRYPRAKAPSYTFKKKTKKVKTNEGFDQLLHLSSYTVRLTPHKSWNKRTKLAMKFNLPKRAANPGVTVRAFDKKGKVRSSSWVKVNKSGKAKKKIGFSRKGGVAYVEVTVSNGSIASTCWQGSADDPFEAGTQQFAWSCLGWPKHYHLRHRMTATVKR